VIEVFVMYKKILVPIDGSEHSGRALQEAIKIAKMTSGAIALIHVHPIGASVITSSKQPFYQLLLEQCKEQLEEGQRVAKAEGLQVETFLLQGDTVENIVRTAKEGKYDLIVIGARGLGKISGFILGSVSQGVVQSAPCPVLVTR